MGYRRGRPTRRTLLAGAPALAAATAALVAGAMVAAPSLRADVRPAPRLSQVARGDGRDADWSHPLAGRYLHDAAVHDIDSLPAALAAADHLLLGEVHDNVVHHRLRGALLGPLLRGDGMSLVMEHLRADQQGEIERLRPKVNEPAPKLVEDLTAALDWQKSGWHASMIETIIAPALATGLPLYAGHPPRERVRAVARGGLAALDALDAAERGRLGLDAALEPPLEAALLGELEASHCGLVPTAALGGMAAAQRYRDAHMAAALVAAREAHGGTAVLLAGNGHVRSDRGVPWHLRRTQPAARILAAVLVEVQEGKNEPAAYLPRDPDGRPAADIVVLTPRVERPDPCMDMRRRMGR